MIDFLIFVVLQGLFINGVKYCFEKDSVFYKIAPLFFEKNKGKPWTMNLWGCVRCMSFPYGTITFWAAILSLHGFCCKEILLWIFDIFCLVSVNFIVYKKL